MTGDRHLKWEQDKLFCEYPLASAVNFCYYGGHSLNLTVHNHPKQASALALILPKSSFLGGISSQQMSLMSHSHPSLWLQWLRGWQSQMSFLHIYWSSGDFLPSVL